MKKFAIGAVLLLATGALVATYVTPWPSVLIIRSVFEPGAAKAAAALASKVPADVLVRDGLSYDPADPDALFDIYRCPTAGTDRPTIVWFHGGGFVSGRRGDVANYLKILAGQGFTVVNVGHTIAPEATYPTGRAPFHLRARLARPLAGERQAQLDRATLAISREVQTF